ncbi:MAG: 5-formyltetrahydrofolate cyclo-ligase [Ruminococcaceae bacterium]|nr:5-formyltetrahydrofolate cyclo-ligase [Oscillospiraceae bacterium]
MTEIRTQKSEMREKYLAVRLAMPQEQKDAFDKKIHSKLTSSITYRHSTDILLYASAKGEVDTWAIFEQAIKDGKKVAFPCCNNDNTMTFRYVTSKDQMKEASFGLLEPDSGCEECKAGNFSLLIVPGLVYDKSGYRIGYGKGFYDRYLSTFEGVAIGLCYSSFLVPEVPRSRYDRHADVIITEKGVYAVNAPK